MGGPITIQDVWWIFPVGLVLIILVVNVFYGSMSPDHSKSACPVCAEKFGKHDRYCSMKDED